MNRKQFNKDINDYCKKVKALKTVYDLSSFYGKSNFIEDYFDFYATHGRYGGHYPKFEDECKILIAYAADGKKISHSGELYKADIDSLINYMVEESFGKRGYSDIEYMERMEDVENLLPDILDDLLDVTNTMLSNPFNVYVY